MRSARWIMDHHGSWVRHCLASLAGCAGWCTIVAIGEDAPLLPWVAYRSSMAMEAWICIFGLHSIATLFLVCMTTWPPPSHAVLDDCGAWIQAVITTRISRSSSRRFSSCRVRFILALTRSSCAKAGLVTHSLPAHRPAMAILMMFVVMVMAVTVVVVMVMVMVAMLAVLVVVGVELSHWRLGRVTQRQRRTRSRVASEVDAEGHSNLEKGLDRCHRTRRRRGSASARQSLPTRVHGKLDNARGLCKEAGRIGYHGARAAVVRGEGHGRRVGARVQLEETVGEALRLVLAPGGGESHAAVRLQHEQELEGCPGQQPFHLQHRVVRLRQWHAQVREQLLAQVVHLLGRARAAVLLGLALTAARRRRSGCRHGRLLRARHQLTASLRRLLDERAQQLQVRSGHVVGPPQHLRPLVAGEETELQAGVQQLALQLHRAVAHPQAQAMRVAKRRARVLELPRDLLVHGLRVSLHRQQLRERVADG
mmetsp:Transcript_28855/g.93861  ORF Transcript_28855/g.93861 Transcript_28855/m.93861 type:complete len:480 (+) Transcript_28855:322-1761(+)